MIGALWPALLALQAAAAPDPADPGWREIDRSDALVMSLNEGALRRDGDNVAVQLRMERPGHPSGERLAVIEARLDCRARTRTALAIHAYHDDGRLRFSDRAMARFPVSRAEPGTNLSDLIDVTCRRTGWTADGRP